MLKAALLSTFVLASTLQAQAPTQSVDQIVNHHIQALGGTNAFKAIQTMRVTGKMIAGPGMEMPMTVEVKKPSKVRVDMTVMGQSMIQVINGKESWMINPMAGSSEPTPMPADMVSKTEEQATQFEGPLVHYKERGSTLELLGREIVDGSGAYKLRLVDKSGQESTLCVDADSYLISKMSTKVKAQGQEMNVTVKMGDYKAVSGILFSHTMEIQIEGIPMTQRMVLEKVEVNAAIDDSRFEMPKKPATPAPAPAPAAAKH